MTVTRKYAKEVYDALILCWRMWKEIADNYSIYSQSSVAKYRTAVFRETGILCAACDFYNTHKITRLCWQQCIMAELWPNGCMRTISPYNSWYSGKGTKKDALKIAEFSQKKADRIAKKWGLKRLA